MDGLSHLPRDRSAPDAILSFGHAGEGAAFGEFLRHARERRGLTLQQISSETKIPRRHLDALEHGDLAAVPGGTYRRGEIRAYAKVVGLDANIALERLERALEAATPALSAQPKKSLASGEHSRRGFALLALGAAAAAVMFLIWARQGVPAAGREQAPGTPGGGATAAVTEPAVATPTPSRIGATTTAATGGGQATPSLTSQTSAVPAQEAAAAADQTASLPVATEGDLVVTTDPPGARVTVNGIGWGSTPLTLRHQSFGEKRIRVTKDKYASEERVVQITGGRPSGSVHVNLRGTP